MKQRSTFLLEVALDQERLKQRIAGRLREYRQSLGPGYPQERVAPAFGVSFSTYQRWERGISMPRWAQLERIADVIGIDMVDLVGGDAIPEVAAGAADAPFDERILALLDAMDRRLRRIERQLEKVAPQAESQQRQA